VAPGVGWMVSTETGRNEEMNDMGDYQRQEAARIMGYRFERPSNKGVIVRKPTRAERLAHDTRIEMLREEAGGWETMQRRAQMSADCALAFAASRERAVAAPARCARLRKGQGKGNAGIERPMKPQKGG
jgi:hypothetical protein